MKKSSILLVPPAGSRVKAIRVRFWMVGIVIALLAVGVVGFLVPVDRLILTAQEIDQKNALEEQNKRLHQNVGATLKLLSSLKEQTARLEEKKVKAKDIIALPEEPSAAKPKKSAPITAKAASELVRRLEESEGFVAAFAAAVLADGKNVFDSIPVGYPVSSDSSIISKRFGMARDPFTGAQKMHYGTDFAAEIGTGVFATALGTVTLVENDPVWGRRVIISHGRNLRTVYAHLGTVRVVQGRPIKKGELIGTVGMSGLTTGPHVHYELWRGDERLNPEEYFFPGELLAMNHARVNK